MRDECSKDGTKAKSSSHQLISTLITQMLTPEIQPKRRRTREELRPGIVNRINFYIFEFDWFWFSLSEMDFYHIFSSGAIGFFGTGMESGSSPTCAANLDSPITGRSAPCLSSTLRFARVKPELGDNNLHQLLKSVLVDT